MRLWRPNTGERPSHDDEGAPPIDKVFVRLRCGMEPDAAWPVDTGRAQTTRWSLDGHPFDIVAWRLG